MSALRIRSAVALACLASVSGASAGVFLPFDGRPADQVVHPSGYLGSGTTLDVTVCLDPAFPPLSGNPEQAIRNVVAEFNRNQGAVGNVSASAPGADFESVLLHEVGHCVGMGHTVFGPSEVGAGSPQLYFANAFRGPNGAFNTAAGADGQRGTRDDPRGDDVNINWYRRGVNNPWAALPAVIDRTTWGVGLGDLPGGHGFVDVGSSFSPCENAANSSQLRGQPATQNTMFPVICSNNTLRQLSRDDVALLRIAQAGRDGLQGSTDDYATELRYVGSTANCDIKIQFTNDAGFALCAVGAQGGGPLGNDIAITTGTAKFQRTVNWQFNTADTTGAPKTADLLVTNDASATTPPPGTPVSFTITAINGGPDVATDVVVSNPAPAGLQFVSNNCPGGVFPCLIGDLDDGQWMQVTANYVVAANVATGTLITSVAAVASATSDPNAANNVANKAIMVGDTPVADLSISKTSPAASAARGTLVTFTVTINNLSTIGAGMFWVLDPTPNGLVFVSNSGACTTNYPCSFNGLAAGGSLVINSTYMVAAGATVGAMITNTASISATTADPVAQNNSASRAIQVSADPPAGLIFGNGFGD